MWVKIAFENLQEEMCKFGGPVKILGHIEKSTMFFEIVGVMCIFLVKVAKNN